MATQRLEWVLVLGAAALACEGAADQPSPASADVEVAFQGGPSDVHAPTPMRMGELRQLADDYLHKEVAPGERGATLAQIRALSPVDGRAFRALLADKGELSGVPLEVYQAMTDVAFENRVSAFDLDAELVRRAVRRAFERHLPDWGRERVEEAIQLYLDSLGVAPEEPASSASVSPAR